MFIQLRLWIVPIWTNLTVVLFLVRVSIDELCKKVKWSLRVMGSIDYRFWKVLPIEDIIIAMERENVTGCVIYFRTLQFKKKKNQNFNRPLVHLVVFKIFQLFEFLDFSLLEELLDSKSSHSSHLVHSSSLCIRTFCTIFFSIESAGLWVLRGKNQVNQTCPIIWLDIRISNSVN